MSGGYCVGRSVLDWAEADKRMEVILSGKPPANALVGGK
jgi:hypothetical protein